MKVYLTRRRSNKEGTFGELRFTLNDTAYIFHTAELPWYDNKKGKSCVPTGEYQLVSHNGTRFQNVWLLKNVPGREAVLIHWGNWAGDTEQGLKSDSDGCILVGKDLALLSGQKAVTDSKAAIDELRQLWAGQDITLVVQDMKKAETKGKSPKQKA